MNLWRASTLTLLLLSIIATASFAHAQESKTAAPIAKERQTEICIASFEEAQLKQRRGKVLFARKLFNDCAAEVCPRQLREDCARHKDEIDRAVPTAVLVVRDKAGNDIESATVKVDGQPFRREAGRATPIDPGPHDIEVSLDGNKPSTSKITIYEGEKSRVIILPLEGGSAQSSPSSPTSPAQTATPPTGEKSNLPLGPIILGSVGVLGLLGGTGMFILAMGEVDERDKQRAAANAVSVNSPSAREEADAYNKSADSHQKAAETNQLLAIVLGVGGVLFVGGAAVWYFVDRSSTSTTKSGAMRLIPVPLLSPTMAGAAFGASF